MKLCWRLDQSTSGYGLPTIEPKNKQILSLSISKERNMFVAERFIGGLVKFNGKHSVSTDGGGTWYPQACRFLGLKHHNHSPYEKSIIERTVQYIKDRTECFDDYFPCRKKDCKLKHIRNWLNMFLDYHNSEIKLVKWTEPLDDLIQYIIYCMLFSLPYLFFSYLALHQS